MDRWVYSTGPASLPDERHLGTLADVRLYDGYVFEKRAEKIIDLK